MPIDITWVTEADVAEALGVPVANAAWLTQVTAAANSWAFRRRASSGYVDDPAVVPDPAVATGVVLYAKALWSERGSVDGFSSFQDLGSFVPTGGMGQVLRLLGVHKPLAV